MQHPVWFLSHSPVCSLLCQDKTGCSASAGFGSNRLQARLATKKAKPDGQFHLEPSMVTHFMLDIVVEDLPGNEKCSKYLFLSHILDLKNVTAALFVNGVWQIEMFTCV
jgi:nucleotidyltransferase/DNA polymerase involved in DNA repair